MSVKIYKVGGCVRDHCLGLKPADIDYVVVGATVADMLANNFSQVGSHFPVFLDEQGNEYALARTETKVSAGHTGFSVKTQDVTLEEDLSRRDFTINAMAMDENGVIIDPHGGRFDLHRKIIRHTSSAFIEDPLRVIRAARFFARYSDFSIDPATEKLCKTMIASGALNSLSYERFTAEIVKMFSQTEQPSRFFNLLFSWGAFTHIDFFRYCFGDIDQSTARHYAQMADKARMMLDDDGWYYFCVYAGMPSHNWKKSKWAVSSELLTLIDAKFQFNKCTEDGASIYNFIRSKGINSANSIHPLMGHFITFLNYSAGQVNGVRNEVSRDVLIEAIKISNETTSDNFVHFGGAEIGKAMAQHRIDMINSFLWSK